ncbi:MAG: hypothetical protein ACE5K0_11930 [Candidatus Methanofastidiosia archaeon]
MEIRIYMEYSELLRILRVALEKQNLDFVEKDVKLSESIFLTEDERITKKKVFISEVLEVALKRVSLSENILSFKAKSKTISEIYLPLILQELAKHLPVQPFEESFSKFLIFYIKSYPTSELLSFVQIFLILFWVLIPLMILGILKLWILLPILLFSISFAIFSIHKNHYLKNRNIWLKYVPLRLKIQ